eukprot:COSAG01_NODE_70_length_28755_cov_34.709067_19_plen_402_part_00
MRGQQLRPAPPGSQLPPMRRVLHSQSERRAHDEAAADKLSPQQVGDDELFRVRADIEWMRGEMRARDEQMLALLRAKDEQMVALLQAKDEQMREIRTELRAKDEQIRDLMAVITSSTPGPLNMLLPVARPAATPPHVPQQTLPTALGQRPKPPAALYATGARTARQAKMRAEPPPHQPTHGRVDMEALRIVREPSGGDARAPVPVSMTAPMTLEVLQAGGEAGEAALASALEAALEALESAMSRGPRRDKRRVRQLCEQVEQVLEEVDEEMVTQLASQCESEELSELLRALDAVAALGIGASAAECVEVVGGMLSTLQQCMDPVAGASRALASGDAVCRLRGLQALQALPQVRLDEAVVAELETLTMVLSLAIDEDRSNEERLASFMAAFTVGFRGGGGRG